MFEIDAALRDLVACGGSDLHLKVGSVPRMRVDGELRPIEGSAPLTDEDAHATLERLCQTQSRIEEFGREGEVDLSYSIGGVGRFRVNAFRQRGHVSIVCRAIPPTAYTIEELGLPAVIRTLAQEERGLILVTGTTGSGKSTTLAAMIRHINESFPRHVVTIEDPIEFVHEDILSLVNQREVGLDTASFQRALRRVLRQDPDVILIGEMRDQESVRTALSAAETGHLVLSTLHTIDAVESVNRIIDFFEPHEQPQVRSMLAGTIRGVVSQRLVRAAGGYGRAAACEILTMTGRVRDMILDPAETTRLPDVIVDGGYYGMQTFDQALLGLLLSGRIEMDEAMRAASRPHDFKLMVESEGKRASSIDQLYGEGSQ